MKYYQSGQVFSTHPGKHRNLLVRFSTINQGQFRYRISMWSGLEVWSYLLMMYISIWMSAFRVSLKIGDTFCYIQAAQPLIWFARFTFTWKMLENAETGLWDQQQQPNFDHRDRNRDCKGLSFNAETETEKVWVSMTRAIPRLKMSESQWRDRDWKYLSLNDETETETEKI